MAIYRSRYRDEISGDAMRLRSGRSDVSYTLSFETLESRMLLSADPLSMAVLVLQDLGPPQAVIVANLEHASPTGDGLDGGKGALAVIWSVIDKSDDTEAASDGRAHDIDGADCTDKGHDDDAGVIDAVAASHELPERAAEQGRKAGHFEKWDSPEQDAQADTVELTPAANSKQEVAREVEGQVKFVVAQDRASHVAGGSPSTVHSGLVAHTAAEGAYPGGAESVTTAATHPEVRPDVVTPETVDGDPATVSGAASIDVASAQQTPTATADADGRAIASVIAELSLVQGPTVQRDALAPMFVVSIDAPGLTATTRASDLLARDRQAEPSEPAAAGEPVFNAGQDFGSPREPLVRDFDVASDRSLAEAIAISPILAMFGIDGIAEVGFPEPLDFNAGLQAQPSVAGGLGLSMTSVLQAGIASAAGLTYGRLTRRDDDKKLGGASERSGSGA